MCILCSLLSTYTKYIQPQGNAAKWRVVVHNSSYFVWHVPIDLQYLLSLRTSLFTMFTQCTCPLSPVEQDHCVGCANRTVRLCKWYPDNREIAHGSWLMSEWIVPGHGTQPCSHVCIYVFYIEYACTILLCAINHFFLHSRAVLNWREDKHTVIARTVFVDWSVCVCVCTCAF